MRLQRTRVCGSAWGLSSEVQVDLTKPHCRYYTKDKQDFENNKKIIILNQFEPKYLSL